VIIDAAIIAVVGFFVWRGMRRGLIATLAGFIGFLFAAAAAVFGFPVLAGPLASVFGWSDGVANLVAALMIFVALMFGVMLGARMLTKALRWTKWGAVNTAAGGAVSGFWALSWVTLALLAVSVLPRSNGARQQLDGSMLGETIVTEAPGWIATVTEADFRTMVELFGNEQRPVGATP